MRGEGRNRLWDLRPHGSPSIVSSLDGSFVLNNIFLVGQTGQMIFVAFTYDGAAVESGWPESGALYFVVDGRSKDCKI